MAAFNLKKRAVLLASAARTADAFSAKFKDEYATGVRLILSVTAASGTGGLTPRVRAYDPVSGNTVEISQGGAAVIAVGTYAYEVFPATTSAPAGSVKEVVSRVLPVVWDVRVAAGDASAYTYSLSAEIV